MAKTKRKGLSRKTRFDVFKRDAFKCVYCSRGAPDVELVVDHVIPLAKGGTDDILNLVTACWECNAGKGPRPLDETESIAKQRTQLEALNARREQIEMLLEWRAGLASLTETEVGAVEEVWTRRAQCLFNPGTKDVVRKLIRKHSLAEVLEASDIAIDSYVRFANEAVVFETVRTAWEKLPGILHIRRLERENPGKKDEMHVGAILRKRDVRINYRIFNDRMQCVRECGLVWESVKEIARRAHSWGGFVRELDQALDDAGHGKKE